MAQSGSNPNQEQSSFQAVDAGSGEPLRLSMQRLWITGDILPIGARLVVQHHFRNAESAPVEAIYTFALPRDAALRRFVMQGEAFRAESELHPAGEARDRYEEGISGGSLSALMQQYSDSLISLSLGNLRPGEAVTVTVEMLAGVESHDDRARFRFPFTLAPCYHSEARAVACPDGAGEIELPAGEFGDILLPRWFRDASVLHAVGFSLDVSVAAGTVTSPSHEIRVAHENNRSIATLAGSGDVPDRDLVLDLPLTETAAAAWSGHLASVPGVDRRQWVARIPSTVFGEAVPAPLRIAFVIDCSGSMQGLPLEQAKVALKASLGCLLPEDSFALIAFGTRFCSFGDALQPATAQSIRAAREWVDRLSTMGATEMVPPLRQAVKVLGGDGRVLLMTDGEVFGQEQILEAIGSARIGVHCLGIGEASQDAFLASLAERTDATSRFVSPRERVDREAMELFAEIRERIATDVEVGLPGVVHHLSSSHVFARRPLTIYGEGSVQSSLPLTLRWNCVSGKSESRQITIPVNDMGESAALLVGAKRIAALSTRIVANGKTSDRERDRTERGLATLSKEYGLASRAMSLVAVHRREDDAAGTVPKTVIVAVGLPRGQHFDAIFSAPASPPVSGLLSSFHFDDSETAPGGIVGLPFDLPRGRALMRMAKGNTRHQSLDWSAPLDADPLPALAAEFEPDGGLPGATSAERIHRTVSALLKFMADGSTAKRGPYRAVILRAMEFLRQYARDAGTHERAVVLLIERIDRGDTASLLAEAGDLGNDGEAISWERIESLAALSR